MKKTFGFTVVEILLALAISGLILTAGFEALKGGLRRVAGEWERRCSKTDQRVALALMAKDLRCAYLDASNENIHFAGRHDGETGMSRLDFVRSGKTDGLGAEPAEVGYFTVKDLKTGRMELWRRTQREADDDGLAGGETMLLLTGVSRFCLRFYDGNVWSEAWGWNENALQPMRGIRGLPLLVSIDVKQADDRSEPDETVVPIMVALTNRDVGLWN